MASFARLSVVALGVLLAGCGAPNALNARGLNGDAFDALKAKGPNAVPPAAVKTVKLGFGSVTLGLLPESAVKLRSMGEAFEAEMPLWEGDTTLTGISIMSQALPKKVDLREFCTPIRNQGSLGSCTAFAATGLMEMTRRIQGEKATKLSPLFLYYAERKQMEESGDTPKATRKDTGASSGLAARTAVKYGCATEADVPYKDGRAALAYDASAADYAGALDHKFKKASRISTLHGMKNALAHKKPFSFGVVIYKNFGTAEVAKTGMMPLPGTQDTAEGGHAVVCVGFDDEKQAFIVRNSWGADWGDKGYFYMPYEFFKTNYVGLRYYNCYTLE